MQTFCYLLFTHTAELEQTLAQKQIEELEKSLSGTCRSVYHPISKINNDIDVKTQHAESTEKLETQKKLSKGMIQEIELLKHRNKGIMYSSGNYIIMVFI